MAINNLVNKIRTGIGAAGSAVNMINGLAGTGRNGGSQKFNVGQVLSNISEQGGLLETNMGLLELTPPPALQDEMQTVQKLLCNSFNLPTRSIDAIDYKRFGYGTSDKRVQGGSYGDLVLSFFVANNGEPLTFFNKWLDNIFYTDVSAGGDAVGGKGQDVFTIKYREQYTVQLRLLVHDKLQNQVLVYEFFEAFPTNIGDVTFEWGSTDSFGVVGVPFTYRYYRNTAIEAPKVDSRLQGGFLADIQNGLGQATRFLNSTPVRTTLDVLNVASAQKLF